MLLALQAVQQAISCLAGADIRLTWDHTGARSTPTYILQFPDNRSKQRQAANPAWRLDVLVSLLLDAAAADKRSRAEKIALSKAADLVKTSLPRQP